MSAVAVPAAMVVPFTAWTVIVRVWFVSTLLVSGLGSISIQASTQVFSALGSE